MTDREIATARHMARLSKLPVRSGHARNLRRKLGISDAPVAPPTVVEEPAPEPAPTPRRRGRPRRIT